MARARILKPGFFANELLAEIHPYGRLLFAGLWTLADREGRLEDRPKRIDAVIFPYEDCDIEALLSELARRGFILRYRKNGVPLLQVVNWHKHQKPHVKESASTLPPPDEPGSDPVPIQPGLVPDTALAGASTDLEKPQHRPELVPDTAMAGVSTDLEQAEHRPGLVPDTALAGASTDLDKAQPRPGLVPDSILEGADTDLEKAQPQPGLVPDTALASASTDLEQAQHQSSPPCSLLPLPESLLSCSLLSESRAAPRPGEAALCKTLRESGPTASDSDIHTNVNTRDSELTSLAKIAQKVKKKFTPSETAGYIMAHFPMQQLSPGQRPLHGDTGLTVDQVSCLVRHGCTVEMAQRAFQHFRQKQVPQKSGAWAFHCLKNELPQDARIDLREETRSAQREFKEKSPQKQTRAPHESSTKQGISSGDRSPPPHESSPQT